MSQQTTLTAFFQARRRAPDVQAAKRRKILVEETVTDVQETKVGQDAVSVKQIESTFSVITSTVDNHVPATCPKTPSVITEGAENVRSSKRRSREQEAEQQQEAAQHFCHGKAAPAAQPAGRARKRLPMTQDVKRNVAFTKLSALSPKKARESAPLLKKPTESAHTETFKKTLPKSPQQVAKDLFGESRSSGSRPAVNQAVKPLFKEPLVVENRAQNLAAAVQTAKAVSAKLTPAEVKAKLGKTGKLGDLKARLASLNQESQKLKALSQTIKKPALPKLTDTKVTFEIEVPVSPSKVQPPPSPVKASPKKVPAYQRFDYLARPVDKTLPLPYNYRMLAEVFRCTDTVVAMLFNRREIISLPKLGKAVQEMMRKNFGEKFLKQIKCVFPQAYHYAWERILNRFCEKKEDYELHITPNLKYKRELLTQFGAPDNSSSKDFFPKLLPEMLVERRNIFHNSLLQMVKDQHREFLASLQPPIQVVDDRLTRWHKDFNLESCHEIDTLDFPTKPTVEKFTTAQEVLEKANQMFSLNPRLGESLKEISERIQDPKQLPAASAEPAAAVTTQPAAPAPELPKALRGLNPKLLEKIRAKEAEKARVEMMRKPADIKRINQLKRMPSHVRALRSLFIGEKKPALILMYAVKKLTESYPGSIETAHVEDDLRLLAKEIEGWLSFHVVCNVEYIKINAKQDVNTLCDALEIKMKEAEKK